MIFTDSAGRRWIRNPLGQIRRLNREVQILGDHRADAALSLLVAELNTLGSEVAFQPVDFDELYGVFLQDSGKVPGFDCLIGAHDWVGNLVANTAIAPVDTVGTPYGSSSWISKAFMHHGRSYGIPIMVDTVALIRDADRVPRSPSSIEELIASLQNFDGDLSTVAPLGLRVGPRGDPFQMWPLFTGAGGRLFGDYEPGAKPATVLIDTPESIRAFEKIRTLGNTLGAKSRPIVGPQMGRQESIDLFCERKTPFLISTSDVIRDISERCSFTVQVSAVPPWEGFIKAPPFSLVLGAMLAAHGPNRVSAEAFLPQFFGQRQTSVVFSEVVSGPPAHPDADASNDLFNVYRKIAESAIPMPSFAGMKEVWDALREAELQLLAGERAGDIAATAGREIRLILGLPIV